MEELGIKVLEEGKTDVQLVDHFLCSRILMEVGE